MDGGTEGGIVPVTPSEDEDAGTTRKDGGMPRDASATTSSEVEIKNLSFSGTADTGSFTFIVTNGSPKLLDRVTEVRVKFAEGEMIFPAQQCTKLSLGDDLYLAPGATSEVITMTVNSLYYSSSGYVSLKCGGITSSLTKASGPSLLSSTSLPEALAIRGIYDDAAKWTAVADVEE